MFALPGVLLQGISRAASPASRKPAVSELLDKYAAAMDELRSFKATTLTSTSAYSTGLVTGKPWKSQCTSEIQVCFDGRRASIRTKRWGKISNDDYYPKDKPYYLSALWDGTTFIHYRPQRRDANFLMVEQPKGPDAAAEKYAEMLRDDHSMKFFLGYFYPFSERIDSVLRHADSVSIRPDTARIGDGLCYVIDAAKGAAKYTVWLDPQHGWNIAGIEIDERYARTEGLKHSESVLKNVRFKQFGHVWMPVAADLENKFVYHGGHYSSDTYHIEIKEMILNPDHDKLKSFEPVDIRNDSDVLFLNGVHRRGCKWLDGRVLDETGNTAMDCRPQISSGFPGGVSPVTDTHAALPAAGAAAQRDKQPGIWDLLRKSIAPRAAAADVNTRNGTSHLPAERIVHFPADRSIGKLTIQDADTRRHIKSFFYWTDTTDSQWEYLGQARGSVTVPAGKRLALEVAQDAWKDLSALSGLEPDDLYMLTIYASSQGGMPPDDGCMTHIAHLTGLKVLTLENTRISARGAESLRHLANLERLGFSGSVTDRTMAEIAQLPRLKALYLNKNRMTNAGLAHLQKLAGLEEFSLGEGRINDAGLLHLAKLPSLTYLMLQGETFTDAGIACLKNSPSLKILHLGHMRQLTDTAVAHISEIATLENLSLHWNENITDSGISHLRKLGNLKMLDIANSQVTVRGVAHLAEIKSIDSLWLPGRIMNDEVLSYLGQLSNLRELHIAKGWHNDPKNHKTYYTDRGLAMLSGLKNLEKLSIGSIGVTDEGMSHIAAFTKLRGLTIFGCPVTDAGCAKLLALKSLERLNLSHTEITIDGLSQLSALANLTNLDVHDAKPGRAALDLSGLANLRKLGLFIDRSSHLTDADLTGLSGLKKLEWLQMGPRRFSDKGLAHLAGLTEMDRLGIGGPDLTDEGLRHLAGMTKLNHLSIDDGSITDQGLRRLEAFPNLGYLFVTSRSRISASAQRRLREHLPGLYIRVTPKK